MGRNSLKEIRQKEIIKGFYKVAKKEGLDNTSIAKVADHMGINPSLIIHYFKTKEELLLSFNDYILNKYRSIYKVPDGKVDTEDKLIVLIDRLFSKRWNKLISDSVFYSCYALTYRNKKQKDRFKQIHDELRKLLKESLIEAKDSGVINIDKVDVIAEKIFFILEGAYYYLGMVNNEDEYNDKMQLARSQVYDLLQIDPS
jgi:AcrR family transcriptional regulator